MKCTVDIPEPHDEDCGQKEGEEVSFLLFAEPWNGIPDEPQGFAGEA